MNFKQNIRKFRDVFWDVLTKMNNKIIKNSIPFLTFTTGKWNFGNHFLLKNVAPLQDGVVNFSFENIVPL